MAQRKTPDAPAPTPRSSRRTRKSNDERIVRKAMERPDAEREKVLQDIKRSVQSGTYDPPAGEVAAAIIDEAISRLSEERLSISRATTQKAIICLAELEELLRTRTDHTGAEEVAAIRDELYVAWRFGSYQAPLGSP
jgi:anti-sigma28 factor (negative regulator of flagellin synthesis)